MATISVGEANQQLWDEALTRLLNLSTVTVKRNVDLESRVADLEVELSVWKQAHSTVLETSEREMKAYNMQLSSLNRQISTMESLRSQNPLILCVVDGDGNIFSQYLLEQGQQGGRQAAQQLTKGIAEYLSNEDVRLFGRLSFWVSVYFNKTDLMDTLIGHEICTQEQFEAFLVGFSQASPRFLMIDAGYGKEATDVKIREYIQTFTPLPQTLRVFFGGHGNGYSSILTALEKEQLLGKLVILQGYDEASSEAQRLSLPVLKFDGLFMTPKLFPSPKKLAPLNVAPFNVSTNGGLISPESPGPAASSVRSIDPSLPLHKQVPPPCNEHYLMTCSKGGACKYSHDYLLTPEQLASLACNAKKAPCNWLKNGLQCPFGDKCCWGHVCPSGPKCFHLSKGKCWFKGETMHPASTSPGIEHVPL